LILNSQGTKNSAPYFGRWRVSPKLCPRLLPHSAKAVGTGNVQSHLVRVVLFAICFPLYRNNRLSMDGFRLISNQFHLPAMYLASFLPLDNLVESIPLSYINGPVANKYIMSLRRFRYTFVWRVQKLLQGQTKLFNCLVIQCPFFLQ
jgi:hypothetical protein